MLTVIRRFGLDDQRTGRWAVGLVLVVYGWLAFVVLSPDALYSGDVGIKYVQAQSLASNGFRRLDIPYRAQAFDPARRFTPFRPPFVMTVNGQTQAIFSPGTAILQGIFVAIAGFSGMIAASLVSAGVVVWATWRLASDSYRAVIPIVIGLATPLWFYGTVSMDHAPAMALTTLSLLVAVRPPGVWPALLSGLLLGLAAAVRDEAILIAPGLAFALWMRDRHIGRVLAAAAGLTCALVAAGAIEVWWFHRPLAAHLQHAVHLLRGALHATDAPNPDVPALAPLTLRERYDTVIVYWLLGYGRDWLVALFAVWLVAAWGLRWRWQWRTPIAALIVTLAALAAWDAWALLQAPKWVAGLYRLSPFLIFAVLPAPSGPEDTSSRLLRLTAIVTLVAYVILAFIGTDTSGGKSLGPRLLMPLLPLLTIAAWQGIVQHLRAPHAADRWIGRAGLALVAIAFAVHLGSTIPAYARRSAEDGAVIAHLRDARDVIVLADDMFTAQLLLSLYHSKIIVLADSPALADEFAQTLEREGLTSFLTVTRHGEGRFDYAGFHPVTTNPIGRMVVQAWRK